MMLGMSSDGEKAAAEHSRWLKEILGSETSMEFLASELYWKMWTLDPIGEKADWDGLHEIDKEDYRQAVQWLLIQIVSNFCKPA